MGISLGDEEVRTDDPAVVPQWLIKTVNWSAWSKVCRVSLENESYSTGLTVKARQKQPWLFCTMGAQISLFGIYNQRSRHNNNALVVFISAKQIGLWVENVEIVVVSCSYMRFAQVQRKESSQP